MKENIFRKIFFNFFMFGWLKCFEKYFSYELIFLQNVFLSKGRENIFQNSFSNLLHLIPIPRGGSSILGTGLTFDKNRAYMYKFSKFGYILNYEPIN